MMKKLTVEDTQQLLNNLARESRSRLLVPPKVAQTAGELGKMFPLLERESSVQDLIDILQSNFRQVSNYFGRMIR